MRRAAEFPVLLGAERCLNGGVRGPRLDALHRPAGTARPQIRPASHTFHCSGFRVSENLRDPFCTLVSLIRES